MKRMLLWTLALVVLMATSALAITEGPYEWEGETIEVTVNDRPLFAPAGMTDDERGLALELIVPETLFENEEMRGALYSQTCLVAEDGTVYAPGAATRHDETRLLTYLFAIPKDVELETLTLQFIEPSGIPAEYVGKWQGKVDNIDLSFHVEADGTGEYTFEQSGYSESYAFSLSLTDDTFSVDVPAENKLGISGITGTYAYADDVLTLDVHTAFQRGGEYAYVIPCTRVEE